ncbi:hypothetical protein [Mycolicibacterium arenosum]|uniref:Integral membrane protein n=1 Tax=Mycolicibacterium arenosum TaxID=2952157 RepID=A0ABT1M741_9MYCO|nr:hypothetical protein [Mycolicibacterium sp. CAU 1645]MCP9274956.1 hypothetical protein [Mycolicibacterium sp. CAU 1645]
MNYPNGPYGQGFPVQQPGNQQWGYPQQQPYGYPPAPPAAPNGATGIIAGVLAGLGALVNVVGGIFMAIGLTAVSDSSLGESGFWGGLMAVALLNVTAGVLLVPGTVMLLLRKMIGRWLVVAGCAVSIVSSLMSLGMFSTMSAYTYGSSGTNAVSVIFPIATLILVLLPSTTAWIRAKRTSAPPQHYPPQHYPPQPPHPGYRA